MLISYFNIFEPLHDLFLSIDSIIYGIIGKLYEVFIVLSSFQLFSDDKFKSITTNIELILGIVVLFLLAYQLLNYMINIDDAKTNLGGIKKIVLNVVTSIALVALIPTIFNFLYDFQASIINNNVLGKIILSGTDSNVIKQVEDSDNLTEKELNHSMLKASGNSMAVIIFQSFFYPSDIDKAEEAENESDIDKTIGDRFEDAAKNVPLDGSANKFVNVLKVAGCIALRTSVASKLLSTSICNNVWNRTNALEGDINLKDAYDYASVTGDFSIFKSFSSLIDNTDSNHYYSGRITYLYFLSTMAGIFAAYVILLYCIDLGLRAIKLAFYQVIAPIPIFMRILPKNDKVFNSYVKAVSSTYFEVFTRMSLLFFIVFVISIIPDITKGIFSTGNIINISSIYYASIGASNFSYGITIYLLVRVIIIIGLLIFIKHAPEIIEEATGIKSKKFSLNFWDHLKDAAWLPSAVGGFAANLAGGGNVLTALKSGLNSGKSGWKNGDLKGIGQAYKSGMAYKEAKMRGANNRDIFANRLRDIVGLDTTAEQAEREIKDKARTITNNTSAAFTFKDKNGNVHTINAGEEIEVDPLVIADLEAQILANKGKIAEKNEVMTKLDEKKQWAEAQKGLKDFFDSDGEKAWKNGKFKYKTCFADQNGNIVEKELDYEEFIKLREIGTKFYNDKNEEITGKKVLDAAREYWSIHELSSADPTGTKTQLETFLGRLESEGGYSYDKFLYNEDGTPVRGKDGSIILSEKGSTFNTTIENGKRVVIHSKKVLKTITNQKGEIEYVRDSNGDYVYEEQQLKYTEAGNGEYSFSDENGVHKASVYSVLADIMDKAAKGDIAVIDAEKEKIRTQSNGSEPSLIELQGANKAMEATKKAFEEMQTGDLQTQEQRAREAAKKYHANNNKQ